jgi:hypothetical protein
MDPNFEWHTRDEKLLVVDYWWKEQRGLCFLCGELMKPYKRQHSTDPDAATIEHVIPRRENGPNTAGNIRLAHGCCNNALGALWQQNQHRKRLGLPEITQKEALASAAGRRRAKLKPQPHMTREQIKARKERGEAYRAMALSLPRGATLTPEYQALAGKHIHTKKAFRMTAQETARWLAEQGIKGA